MAPEAILAGLTGIANDWRWLAIAWHIFLATLLVRLVTGWRPSSRLIGQLLITPLLSVSLLAWLSGNPFNGTAFGVLAAALLTAANRFSKTSAQLHSPAWAAPGVALIMFGWAYPHFLTTDSWTTYLYASPFGLLPCPTLSVVIGITLLFRECRPSLWSTALVVAGLLYGAMGVFGLGVALDWALLAAAAILATKLAREAPVRSAEPLTPSESHLMTSRSMRCRRASSRPSRSPASSRLRGRFRRYWALASPGIAMIRRRSLQPLKRDAERRAGAAPLMAREHA